MTKKIFIIAFIVLIMGLLAFIIVPIQSYPSTPIFSAPNLQGKVINNQNLNNKVTLLNFWFPSCPGCVSEMPKLIKMSQDYQGKDFQIIGIAVPIDSIESVHHYAHSRQLPFEIIFDDNKIITKQFVKTELFPTSVLINKQGKILKTFVGEPNFEELYAEIDKQLEY